MNIVMLSPHFPTNYYHFSVHLRRLGVNVLGIADASYNELRPELQWALREYFPVNTMLDYEQLLKACGYFTYRYGKLDAIE